MRDADRIVGALLFLPVPVVLVLVTRFPLLPSHPAAGVPLALAVAAVIVATHRLYARPWAVRRAAHRCLWCGGPIAGERIALPVAEPGVAPAPWSACTPPHASRAAGMVGWSERHGLLLRGGILGGLALLFVLAWPAAAGRLGTVSTADVVNGFRLLVAVAVLPLGWLGPRSRVSPGPWRAPFPVHIQALIGSCAVAWLFRLVGLWWLIAALLHAAERFGLR